MCRLISLMAIKTADLKFSLLKAETPFKNSGESNPDGWGIGWNGNDKTKV